MEFTLSYIPNWNQLDYDFHLERNKKMEKGNEELHKEMLLEQYRFALEQRARNANFQWQLIGIGNTLLGGMLLIALSSDDSMISTLLAAISVPISFFIFIAYRKEVYFEDLFSENIEAIEKSVEGLRHIQYDTHPQKSPDQHYITRYPRKWSLEQITIHSIMTMLFGIFAIASLTGLYVFGKEVISQYILIPLVIGFIPALWIVTMLINNPNRIAKPLSEVSRNQQNEHDGE